MAELRLALRRLAAHPGATAASVLTLACSIGAGAATWSLLSALLIRPLPVADPDRLLVLGLRPTQGRDAGVVSTGFTYPFYPYLRDSGAAGRVAAYWTDSMVLIVSTGTSREPRELQFVSRDFFDVLGVRVQHGRGFGVEDDQRGARRVALLTERWWRVAFGADPDVPGRTITIAGKDVTIVGVLQKGFRGISLADQPDLFMPLESIRDVGSALTNYFAEPGHGSSPTAGVGLVARIPEGQSVVDVRARIQGLPMPLPPRRDVRGTPPRFDAIGIAEHAIPAAARQDMVQFTRLLGITVGLLLLIGCGTVGMLLLVRTEARREELAVCLALGASRFRLAASVVAEGGILSVAGAAASLPIAQLLFRAARSFQLPGGVSVGLLELGIDTHVLAAVVSAALAGCLIIAVVAGALGFRAGFDDALRSKSGITPRVTRRRTRAALLTAQVAVSLVLVAGTGLFVRSLVAALQLNPGFETARLLATTIPLTPHGYDEARAASFFDDLADRLQGNPALGSFAFSVPQGGMTPAGRIVIDGGPRQFPTLVSFVAVDDQYFRTIGLAPLAGRNFTDQDFAVAPRVTIVSQSLGRMIAEGGTPLTRHVTMPHSRLGEPPEVMEVVGIVPDIITNVAVDQPLVMYFPLAQHPGGTHRTLTARASGGTDAARAEVSAAIRAIDRAVIPGEILSMRERIGRQMGAQQMGAFVLGTLGTIALLLTLLGTFVLAESMAIIRKRELGIRAALGASRHELVLLVVLETFRLVGLGVVAGLTLAWLGAGAIRAFLFRIQPLDPVTLAAVAAFLLALACTISLRPALRAARVDLAAVLKAE